MTIEQLLKMLVEQRGSDLFLSVGAPPMLKVEGVVSPVGDGALTGKMVDEMIDNVTSRQQREQFDAVRAHTTSLTDAEVAGGLAVAIVDTATAKPVWHMLVSKRLFADLNSSESISAAFLDIFSEFPPNQF